MNNNPWKTISSQITYQNPWMRVREDSVIRPDGSSGIYGVVESKDSVVITAISEKDEIYLIRSFSYPTQAWRWGLPGGGGDDEEPLIAAQRELLEETGITARSWTSLGKIRVSSGLLTESSHFFVAQDISFGDRPASDDTDLINDGKFVSFETIDEMIQNDEIDDTQCLSGLYLVQRWLAHK